MLRNSTSNFYYRNSTGMDMYNEKWFKKFKKNKPDRKKILDDIKKLGFPLEIQASTIIEKFFTTNEGAYFTDEKNGKKIIREIDITAHKIYEIRDKDPDIGFTLNLVFECKYSSNRNFIVFETSNRTKKNSLLNLPNFINGKMLNYKYWYGILPGEIKQLFGFERYTKNIFDLKVGKNDKLEKNDKFYSNCTQLIGAVEYKINQVTEYQKRDYNNFYVDNYRESFLEFSKKTGGSSLYKFMYEPHPNYPLSGHFNIEAIIPILIVNKENKILLAKLSKTGTKVTNLKEIKSTIYFYHPLDYEKYQKTMGNKWVQPIVVTKIENLEKTLKQIIAGTEKLTENLKKETNDPRKIFQEIINFQIENK